MEETKTLSKFDRIVAGLQSVGIHTKVSTIEDTSFIGEATTYILETARHDKGDYLILKVVDGDGVVRLVLPPTVTKRIADQRDSITTRSRSIASKQAMKQRMANGWKPAGFAKKAKRTR